MCIRDDIQSTVTVFSAACLVWREKQGVKKQTGQPHRDLNWLKQNALQSPQQACEVQL